MTTNLGAKIIEKESGIKSKAEQKEGGFKITPDEISGWQPTPEPIKDPELFERVAKLVNDELKNFFRPEFLNRIDEIIVFNHLTRMDIWEICDLMIKSVQKRLKEKGLNLIVDLSVQAFLTDEGYDPIYGARPLRRAIMKYLEDTLAEQCLAKTLYPNTKIYVRRKKVEGTLMTYTNELEVDIDFSDVDPALIKKGEKTTESVPVLLNSNSESESRKTQKIRKPLGDDDSKSNSSSNLSKFFRKKT
jgi:ATP-dependent Clp protease ATP-binding subunit ClpA